MPSGHGGNALAQPSGCRGVLITLSTSLMLCACAQAGGAPLNLEQSTPYAAARQEPADPRSELDRAIAYWGQRYAKSPHDKKAAVSYARNLKAGGQKQAALSVLQQASVYHGNDRELASEYGRLALEFGQVGLAQKLLAAAHDPANPDWRVISAQGTVLAKQGDYKGAIPYYERALQLAPDQPSVINNLAMALAADGQPAKAEPLLRRAATHPDADPRVRQNLALVLGLQGKQDGQTGLASATADASSQGTGNATTSADRKGAALHPRMRQTSTISEHGDDWSTRVAAAQRY